jgi:hypothetical protein
LRSWRLGAKKCLTEPVLTAGQFARTEKTLKHSNAKSAKNRFAYFALFAVNPE